MASFSELRPAAAGTLAPLGLNPCTPFGCTARGGSFIAAAASFGRPPSEGPVGPRDRVSASWTGFLGAADSAPSGLMISESESSAPEDWIWAGAGAWVERSWLRPSSNEPSPVGTPPPLPNRARFGPRRAPSSLEPQLRQTPGFTTAYGGSPLEPLAPGGTPADAACSLTPPEEPPSSAPSGRPSFPPPAAAAASTPLDCFSAAAAAPVATPAPAGRDSAHPSPGLRDSPGALGARK